MRNIKIMIFEESKKCRSSKWKKRDYLRKRDEYRF